MTTLNFDATNVPPAEAPEVMPPGWYTAQMTESESAPTNDNTGTMLKCTFTIMGGEHAGRKVFDRLNLQNKNPVAVEIAYKTLSAICHAVGVIQVTDSQQLHGRPLQLKLALRPAGPGADGKHYEAQNEIKGYKAVGQATGPSGPAAPSWVNAPVAAAPGNFTPPAAFPPGYAPPPAQAFPAPAPAPAAAPPAPQWQQPAPPPAPAPQAPQAWTQPAPAPAPAPQYTPPPAPPAPPAPAPAPAPANGAPPAPPWAR